MCNLGRGLNVTIHTLYMFMTECVNVDYSCDLHIFNLLFLISSGIQSVVLNVNLYILCKKHKVVLFVYCKICIESLMAYSGYCMLKVVCPSVWQMEWMSWVNWRNRRWTFFRRFFGNLNLFMTSDPLVYWDKMQGNVTGNTDWGPTTALHCSKSLQVTRCKIFAYSKVCEKSTWMKRSYNDILTSPPKTIDSVHSKSSKAA